MAHYSIDFYPKSFARRTSIELVIPSLDLHQSLANNDLSYYQNASEKYPLLLCLCGFGDSLKSFQENTNIDYLCQLNKVACCFISGEDKWYLKMGEIDDYYSFIENDLLDFLYGNFKFLSPKASLGLFGVSMGGFGALYHYLNNLEKFKVCIALSPALKPDRIDESLYTDLKSLFMKNKNYDFNIYLSVGTTDFIYSASLEMDKFLKENVKNVRYHFLKNMDHSWLTWNSQLSDVFSFLSKVGFNSQKL